MSKNIIIAGLDIGTTKICAIVGMKNENGKVEILGMGKAESEGVSRGVVSNIEKTIASIKLAVAEASRVSNVVIDNVYVGIAGGHIKSLQHSGMLTRKDLETEISQADIDIIVNDMHKLAMSPGEEIIHVIPQDFTIDSERGIKDPRGHAGVRLEAKCHIVTGQITAAKNIHKCVERSGLKCTDLILEPLASADAVLTEEEKEAGVVLIDIGGGTTDIAIFHDNIIRHTAVIPFGGNSVTDDIRQGCALIRKDAEALKVKFGMAMPNLAKDNEIISIAGVKGREPKEITRKNLANIIHARMEEIIDQVYYEIKSSGWEQKIILGAVITGGGSQLQHIQQLFEYVTGMDARIGYPYEHIVCEKADLKSPSYATGVGLVLMGIADAEKNPPKETVVVNEPKPEPTVKTRGKWFDIFEKGKEKLKTILEDDEDKDL